MAMNGKQILILAEVEGTFESVAEQTGLSWDNTTNLIEANSKDDEHAKWLPGTREGTVSLEAAYVPNDSAYQALKESQKKGESVVLRRSEDGEEVEEAEAFIESISGDAPDNDRATITIEFQLNEDWSEATVA